MQYTIESISVVDLICATLSKIIAENNAQIETIHTFDHLDDDRGRAQNIIAIQSIREENLKTQKIIDAISFKSFDLSKLYTTIRVIWLGKHGPPQNNSSYTAKLQALATLQCLINLGIIKISGS